MLTIIDIIKQIQDISLSLVTTEPNRMCKPYLIPTLKGYTLSYLQTSHVFVMDGELEQATNLPLSVGNVIHIPSVWDSFYKTKGTPPTPVDDMPSFILMPGVTYYTDSYYWANRETVAWDWSIKVSSHEPYLTSNPSHLFPRNIQLIQLPPSVANVQQPLSNKHL